MQRSAAPTTFRSAGGLLQPLLRRAPGRRETLLGSLPLPLLLHQRPSHSTHAGSEGRPPAAPARKPTRTPPSASSLNPFSQRVRQHLAGLSLPSSTQAAEGRELWMLDRLLYLLLHPDKGDVAPPGSPSASMLHPLLCVRVLERLGHAVCVRDTSDRFDSAVDNARRAEGWTKRHTYPSLTSSGPATDGPLSRHARALSSLTAAVLRPLLPLLGDGTAQHPPHTQVVPVLSVVVEWLCTLPSSEIALPTQQWLPWVVAQYTATVAATAEEADRLPPLLDLLPHLLQKLAPHLSNRDKESCGAVSLLCEEQVAALLHVCWSSAVSTTGGCSAVGDVLWWGGEVPLVHLPGVRRALARVVERDCATAASGVHQNKASTNSIMRGEAASTRSGIAAVQMAPHPNITSSALLCPQLTLRLTDDDAFRRFLLRLAGLQRVLAGAPTDAVVLVALELGEPLVTAQGDATTSNSNDDPDVILRFIQPLYDYVLHLQETPEDTGVPPTSVAGSPVRLTFTAVVHILSAAFQRLEALKRQSSCQHVASAKPAHRTKQAVDPSPTHATMTTTYTLLPQKARLHTLKRVCEILLHHARSVEAVAREPAANAVAVPMFVDVDVRQQEAALRRLCGAARALVRVVMEERRRSLLEEGPEGSVLTASSITAARRSRTVGAVEGERGEGALSTVGDLPMPVAAPDERKGPVVASFEHTLRTLAYRVVEPALWRLSDTCAGHHRSLPVHVLTFADWMACLTAREDVATSGDEDYTWHTPMGTYTADDAAPPELQSSLCIMEAARGLYESVGGLSGLQTARQVLPHPGQQSISALVEGVRLTALQCFIFDGLHSGSFAEREDAEAYMAWVLEHTSAAFFSVWQRTAPQTDRLSSSSSSLTAAGAAAVGEEKQLLRERLGLLTLTLHIRVLAARRFLRATKPAIDSDSAATTFPSSLLHCLLSAHNGSRALSDEWSLVVSNENVLQSCRLPPAGVPSGCASQWELVEELEEAAAAESGGDSCAVTWQWLGSPEALWDVVGQRASRHELPLAAPTFSSPSFFLLPWSTVAQSHQLCRVYDESGQSRHASREWEATLTVWLSGGRGGADGPETVQHHLPVVRLVSIAEELRFFSALQHAPSVQLSSTVRVLSAEVAREVAAVAPTLRRLLDSSTLSSRPLGGAATTESWYAEGDYDGLD